MKNILLIAFIVVSVTSFGQEIRALSGFDPVTGLPGYIYRDTSIVSPFTTLKYLTGYNTWGSFSDTARAAISLTTTGIGAATYSSSTGVLNIPTGVDSIWRTLGQDSIKFSIAGRLRSIKDSTGGGSSLSMAAFGATPNANAGTISGGNLTLQPADTTYAGGITSSGTQLLKGIKKFYSDSIVLRRSGTLNNGNYLRLDAGTGGTSPNIRFFNAGSADIAIGAGTGSASQDFNINASTEINGKIRTIGMVNGTALSDMTTVTPAGGVIVLQPSGSNSAFINFTSHGNFFGGALGMNGSTGNLHYFRNPSARTNFDGNEVFRVVRSTGDLLIGTTTDDTSAIVNIQTPITGSIKGLMPPKMTTTQRTGINSRVVTGTVAGGSGYTPGVYANTALTGGTGTGAKATITVNGSGVVSVVSVTYSGDGGYVISDVLGASGLGPGTGFSLTLTQLTAIGEGLTVYDTTLHKMYTWDGTTWQAHW